MKYENKSRQQLIRKLYDFEIQYKELLQDLETAESNLKQKIKQLDCIYGIIKLIQNPNVTVNFILEGVVKRIQETYKFAKICGIKVSFDNNYYLSKNFSETQWSISERILIIDKELKIILYYFKKKEPLPTERVLLVEICKLLKAIFEFKLVWI